MAAVFNSAGANARKKTKEATDVQRNDLQGDGRNGQGSTFLWTEHYADRTPAARAVEILRDAVFGLGLVVLAAGVAGF